MRISVVIPAFNNWMLTRRCVDTLRRNTPASLLAEIIVADDASTDGVSAAWLAAQTDATAVLLGRNRGFSGACNAGAAICSGDAILFLNNDAFAHNGALEALAAALTRDPSIGIVGGCLLYPDDSLQHAGLVLLPGAVSRWWHIHKRRDRTLDDANVARDFLAVTGAALMIRRDLFGRLGGFDEGFTNGWEDVDLCLRAWCAGARVRYEPRAVLEHLESATLGHDHNHERNERRFIERWERALTGAPRYPLPDVPPIALAVAPLSPGDADDGWALAHVARWWKTHLGAAVLRTRPASRFDRARIDVLATLARRRPTLEISWGNACLLPATGTQRIAFVAPRSPAEACAYARAAQITAWWTPTGAARTALLDAGVPATRATIVRLGADTSPPRRTGNPVVAAFEADAAILTQLERVVPRVRTIVLPANAPPALAGVDIVFAGQGDDRWGLLVPAALGHGCSVVAGQPLDTLSACAPGVRVCDRPQLFAALVAEVGEIDRVRADAHEIYLHARRAFHAYLSTQHVSELARAVTGGTPSAALVEVDPAYARRLRRAPVEPGVSVG